MTLAICEAHRQNAGRNHQGIAGRYLPCAEYRACTVRRPQTNTSLAMCGISLKVAEIAAKQDAALSINVEALKQVIPKDLSAAEIAVRLGTTWIPESDIQQFVMEL